MKIGDYLLKENLITRKQRREGERQHDKTGKRFGACLVDLKFISEIDFKFPVLEGDVVEIGMQTIEIGRTSCTLACEVRSLQGERTVCSIDKMVYIRVNKYGLPKKHGGMSE